MRTIRRATSFKKDFKRVPATPRHAQDAPQLLQTVLVLLVEDKFLPESHRDHALVGTWKDHREYHIKSDLLLIYKQMKESGVLELVRLGSHSELFSH
ncbi:MAG: type II toxin-antitoxin system YafQ family toxin [Desulfovibrio sp.]|jgi:mRNA interferase YafQ|nr:type II toxin-antitoxin system YafQ family toxin [Desulfovibrio sp.]